MDQKYLQRTGRIKLLQGSLSIFAVIAAEIVAAIVVVLMHLDLESLSGSLIIELFGAIAAVIVVVHLGSASVAGTSRDDVAYTARYVWWMLAVAVFLMAFDLYDLFVVRSASLAPDWALRLAQSAALCLAIGVFEEFLFRGIIFNGLLAVMGQSHRGTMRAILVSSIIFGAAHISFSEDFSSPLAATQAVLKIAQTGLYAVPLCVAVLRSKQLGAVSFFHGLDDFLLVMPSVALRGESLSTDYVVEGPEGMESIAIYLTVIALYLPVVIKCLRELHREQLATRGLFMVEAERQAHERAVQQVVADEQGLTPVFAGPSREPSPMGATTQAPSADQLSAPYVVPTYTAVSQPAPQSQVPAITVSRRSDADRDGRPPVPRGLERL